MSFVSVDFFAARQMAEEIEAMGRSCAEMGEGLELEELTALSGRLEAIAADVRRACDAREKLDGDLLYGLRPDYKEVLK
ncbi:MAG: hypothetical protein LUF80_04510 [Oscillospiraceae bacterium]|nr:hypothetical protein [Oscillospiraceae bacterium]MCD7928107.1 hypothetical protein [Oscillospiraceae bacterium]MCD8331868.1 hypothetical protein [Oscillospiraceae bacterium]